MSADPTTAEIHRILQSHISDYKDGRKEIMDILNEQSKVGKESLIQQIKTNGRVTSLEAFTTEISNLVKINTEAISGFKGDRKWIMGAFAILLTIIGGITFITKAFVTSVVNASVKNIQISK